MFKLLAKVHDLERLGESIIHFEIGDPQFPSPSTVVQAAVEALVKGKTHYVSSMGITELRDALCVATEKDLGFTPTREQVLIVPANAVIYFLIRCVVNPGEEVIVPDPGFPTYYSAIDFIGARVMRVPLKEKNAFRMNPEDIRRRITEKTRLIIINSPQNPTGSVMTPEEIEEVADLAEEKDLYLLSDEVYRTMFYDVAKPHSPSMRDQCRKRTILLNSFSKSHAMTGWRLGYAIGPERVIEKMGLLLQTIISCVPPFVQYAGMAALNCDPYIIRAMVEECQKRRDQIVNGLNSLPGISCLKPSGAFYVFPNITGTGMTSREFANFMLEHARVALLPGVDLGECGEGYARLCYATNGEAIAEGVERMRKALASAVRAKDSKDPVKR